MLSRTLAFVRNRLSRSSRDQRSGGQRRSRSLNVETLETRRLLAATDLAAITGVVFFDETVNGFDPGEGVVQATVELFQDNGDDTFDPVADGPADAVQTGVGGVYRFDRLTAGTYFVRQPSQTVGGHDLDEIVSPPIVITAADAEGTPNVVLDSFSTVPQAVQALWLGGNNPDSNSRTVSSNHALGGERDMFAHLTDGNGQISLEVLAFDLPILQFDSTSGVKGRRVVTWDGPDGDGLNLDPTGLGGVDLTDDGNNVGFHMTMGADQDDGWMELRVYTDATHWSSAQALIPNTGGLATGEVLIEFADFVQQGLAGKADMTDVGAVELEIVNDALSVNGRLDLISALGQTKFPQNFVNTEIADLELEKSVDDPTPNVGDDVTFTITVTNQGPDNATGVAVADTLPADLTLVGSGSASQGSYNAATGVWTVGALNVGASATLELTTTVETVGIKTNTAEISAADQFDIDSTPNNHDPDEDDQDDASVIPQVIDLSLTKSVDNARPHLFDEVTFTIHVANDGPDAASGVAIADVLPAGLTFVRPIASQGAYNNGTGVWTVGNLAVGGQASLQIVATVDTLGRKVNTAQVSAADQYDIDSTPANNDPTEDDQDDAEVIPVSADLSVDKTVNNAKPTLGEVVQFTVTLHNAGPDTAHNVTVRDVLPSGLSYESNNPEQGSYNPNTGIWTVGTVQVGQSIVFTIDAEVTESTPQVNWARVETSDEYDPDSTPGNDDPTEDDQDPAEVVPETIDLSVVKTVDDSGPHVGESVTFTMTVHNAGPDPATGVSLEDNLPAGLTYQSHTTARGVYNNGSGRWQLGNLAVGEEVTMTITARVDTGGEMTNVIQVSTADQDDVDSTPGNNVPTEDDQDDALVVPLASIAGCVYEDYNADGLKDPDEPGIGGVALQLTGNDQDGNSVERLQITADDGSYFFGSLPPSDAFGYHIVETQPPEYLDGKESVGNLGGQIGAAAAPGQVQPAFLGQVSPAAVGDSIGQIVLGSGDTGVLYNFGEVRTSSIAGRVYFDANKDGVWQPREKGIPGVTIVLTGFDDLGNTILQEATTDRSGRYSFTDLRPASNPATTTFSSGPNLVGLPNPAAILGYSLSEAQPAGYTDGQERAGTPNLNAEVLDDAFSALELGSGVDAIEFNFGEIVNVISKRRFLASSG